jgi:hypothetical protein
LINIGAVGRPQELQLGPAWPLFWHAGGLSCSRPRTSG